MKKHYYIVIIFICLYYLYSCDTIYLDSIEPINEINNENINQNTLEPKTTLSTYGRLKGRLLWHWFGHSKEKFNTYAEFKRSLDPSFSIRSAVKAELKEIWNDPKTFIKNQQALTRKKVNKHLNELNRNYWSRRRP